MICPLFVFFFIHAILAANPVVDLGYSVYSGEELSNDVTKWLGMRYAAAPVGTNRWRAPGLAPVDRNETILAISVSVATTPAS